MTTKNADTLLVGGPLFLWQKRGWGHAKETAKATGEVGSILVSAHGEHATDGIFSGFQQLLGPPNRRFSMYLAGVVPMQPTNRRWKYWGVMLHRAAKVATEMLPVW